MPLLKKLSLVLPCDEPFYSFSQVFPPIVDGTILNLRQLSLQNISIPHADLVGLLFINLPQLTVLDLAHIRLVGGSWEDIVEGLRRLLRIRECFFGGLEDEWGVPYTLEDDDNSQDFDMDEFFDFMERLAYYAIHGGRHPNLLKNAPDSEAELYMSRLTSCERAFDRFSY